MALVLRGLGLRPEALEGPAVGFGSVLPLAPGIGPVACGVLREPQRTAST